jgi:anti-sigma factor RsiW
MSFPDDVLAAYADGELDQSTRIAVESAMTTDPQIARRIEQHRALRKRLRTALDPVLDEPVPAHLIELVRNTSAPSAVQSKAQVIPLRDGRTPRQTLPWWAALAASLILGIIAGRLVSPGGAPGPIATHEGHMMARGLLAQALTQQLASQQRASEPVQLGVSFRSKSGEYCRTFSMRAPLVAGLACHAADGWRLEVLSNTAAGQPDAGAYRQAASSMPPALVSAVSNEIAGEPLDASAEAAARSRGWQP